MPIVVYSKKFGKVIQIEIGQEKLKNNDNKQKTWGNWANWEQWSQWSDWAQWSEWSNWSRGYGMWRDTNGIE